VIAHPLKGVASKLVAVLGFICLAGVLILSAAKLAAGTYNPFIYFRF
jgi:hypothetical protein